MGVRGLTHRSPALHQQRTSESRRSLLAASWLSLHSACVPAAPRLVSHHGLLASLSAPFPPPDGKETTPPLPVLPAQTRGRGPPSAARTDSQPPYPARPPGPAAAAAAARNPWPSCRGLRAHKKETSASRECASRARDSADTPRHASARLFPCKPRAARGIATVCLAAPLTSPAAPRRPPDGKETAPLLHAFPASLRARPPRRGPRRSALRVGARAEKKFRLHGSARRHGTTLSIPPVKQPPGFCPAFHVRPRCSSRGVSPRPSPLPLRVVGRPVAGRAQHD